MGEKVFNKMDQASLINAILIELDKQYPGCKAEVGLMNTVIKDGVII